MPVRWTRLLPLILALLLGACARGQVMYLYEGKTRPTSEVAVVRVPMELEVLRINGHRIQGFNTVFSMGHTDLHLEPGHYRITAYYKNLWPVNGRYEAVKSRPVIFFVRGEAGHAYELGFPEPDSLHEARELAENFHGWSVDRDTGTRFATRPADGVPASLFLGSVSSLIGPPASGDVRIPAPLEAPREGPQPPDNDETDDQDKAYLELLKTYWRQAGPEERRAFSRWLDEERDSGPRPAGPAD